VAFSAVASANRYLEEVSQNPGLLQYLAPIIPDDELLFKHGVLAQAGMQCNPPQLAYCQVRFYWICHRDQVKTSSLCFEGLKTCHSN
jgi:hypothetical protein